MVNLALKQIFKQLVQRTPFPARIFTRVLKSAFDRSYLNPTLTKQMQKIDQQLKNHDWISGKQFSIADVLIWFPLKASYCLNQSNQIYPNIQRYLDQIESRPAFLTALAKGQWSAQIFQNYWSSAY